VRKSEGGVAKGGEDQPSFVKVDAEIADFLHGMFDRLDIEAKKAR